MRTNVAYTYLCFVLNSLLDKDKKLDIEYTKELVRNGQILHHLESEYGLDFDISLFDGETRKTIQDRFIDMETVGRERKKMGIENNGLCLLIGYSLEAIQHPTE